MASYEYVCPGDGQEVIIERPMSEPETDYFCSVCSAKLQRIWNAPPVKFNGTGFYSTGG